MTPKRQRIAIAEACGWKRSPEWDWKHESRYGSENVEAWTREAREITSRDKLPNYLNDLNAMHEAEATLKDRWYDYEARLKRCLGANFWHATAAQRAEAFLRAIGKWEES